MWYFVTGIIVGFSIGAMSITALNTSYFGKMNGIIAECEATLPRNEHCEFIAIPIDKENIR